MGALLNLADAHIFSLLSLILKHKNVYPQAELRSARQYRRIGFS